MWFAAFPRDKSQELTVAGLYSEDLKRRVREANNLVDVVQAAVGRLTRAGRNLKACCPFHNEKTPSFNVNAEGQYFKCFGCGKSGDVFTFVMLHERVDFPEAFRLLADRAGIRIEVDPKAAEKYKKETDFKSYLYRLNEVARKFFRELLFSDAGKAAREYLKKRGLKEETCEQFGLGYAPAGGSPLTARLRDAHRAPAKAILNAGLASQRDEGGPLRDFFFDRLMFPITDMQGRVIAFGGRVLGEGEPKYLNTRDTLLFHKTQTVYGIDHAREEIVKTREAILVEGYTDVMMCHQYGVTNVVACLGTAITAEHIRQLRRVADKVLLLTDADAAGERASERSLAVLFQEVMDARVARLPGKDKDPCDFLLAQGKDAFVAALGKRMELFEYKFEMARQKHDILAPLGLKQAAQELMELISLIPDTPGNKLLRNEYRRKVSERLNIDERDLAFALTTRTVAEVEQPEEIKDVGNVPAPENEAAISERELLKFLFHHPAWLEQAVVQVDLSTLAGTPERHIGRALLKAIAEGKLPHDINTLSEADAGSMMAREVLQRIQNAPDDGIIAADHARSLCVALAEEPPEGSKLDPQLKLEMCVARVRTAALNMRIGEEERRLTHAKLSRNAETETAAYEKLAALRKELAQAKTRQVQKL